VGIRDRLRDRQERDDWKHRRGRFAGLDPDTPDRPQVMPRPEPDGPLQRLLGGLGETWDTDKIPRDQQVRSDQGDRGGGDD